MRRKRSHSILTHAALILVVFLLLSPVLIAFVKSTQTRAQIYHFPPVLGFGSSIVENYKTAWSEFHLGTYMKNSFIIAMAVTVAKTILSMLTGLAIVYFEFPLKNLIFYFILFTLMMPTQILIIALFSLISDFGLGNTYAALIMPFLASATGVFLFRQHFSSISPHLADAARVDQFEIAIAHRHQISDSIPGHARHIVDNGKSSLGKPIQDTGLAHIRPADDDNLWNAHGKRSPVAKTQEGRPRPSKWYADGPPGPSPNAPHRGTATLILS